MEKLKSLASSAFGIAIFIAVLSLPLIFIMGAAWASKNLLQPLILIGWVLLALDIVILLPLSLFSSLRGYTGTGIYISSFVFGLVAWLLGFVLAYTIWGVWAVVIGILFMGGGVVPIALAATAFGGYWDPFFSLLVISILTFVSRFVGLLIAEPKY
ncbi:hypothetical protein F9L16_01705 [Agarivorans sp. B2Z047]|uniref:hypothetical protein n=1 Tax=Agarivorans sp. B2Z047 TaxID=2652721 RepID=UPI00128CC390|nr:hypothetical protein [Agarivorans sp. B2Z047]MPW27715.1 hypothetical protein [Agarivorans sp. B2Z047]UQN44446.1 hypothetical protein LQZ07_08255 [Agarivorans sp. B2Z047]